MVNKTQTRGSATPLRNRLSPATQPLANHLPFAATVRPWACPSCVCCKHRDVGSPMRRSVAVPLNARTAMSRSASSASRIPAHCVRVRAKDGSLSEPRLSSFPFPFSFLFPSPFLLRGSRGKFSFPLPFSLTLQTATRRLLTTHPYSSDFPFVFLLFVLAPPSLDREENCLYCHRVKTKQKKTLRHQARRS